ncbi:SMI1/KNR4 family protein [Pedobacter sp. B4-66]|uniref:SMI1/KNR4 family protein n=1 Tax=Pedobacter sp. B4-66 TaxID=2817280 RepID=UPI001BDA4612|nr:SMI1/KNR4 family protein [Pedobacter sp. B4-66]
MLNNILKKISELSIKSEHFNSYSNEQIKANWIGNNPSKIVDIESVEKNLGIKLPQDYKDFLLITNGFAATRNHTKPRFEAVENIDYLVNIDNFIVEIWNQEGLEDIGRELARSILIAGIEEEQYFLIIPPKSAEDSWKYWMFASWLPGELPYKNLLDYFKSTLESIEKEGYS